MKFNLISVLEPPRQIGNLTKKMIMFKMYILLRFPL